MRKHPRSKVNQKWWRRKQQQPKEEPKEQGEPEEASAVAESNNSSPRKSQRSKVNQKWWRRKHPRSKRRKQKRHLLSLNPSRSPRKSSRKTLMTQTLTFSDPHSSAFIHLLCSLFSCFGVAMLQCCSRLLLLLVRLMSWPTLV